MKEIMEFMEEAVKEGLTKEEIMSQIDLILDKEAQKLLKKGMKEIKEGRAKHFKNARELIAELHKAD